MDAESPRRVLRLVPTFRRTEGALTPPDSDGELLVEIKTQFDNNVRRTIAKIAFNLLAARMGATFILSPDFDAVRAFIRDGTGDSVRIVRLSGKPILADETDRIQFHFGHVVTLGWTADKSGIVGQVSLFNQNTYEVALAPRFVGLYRPDVTYGVESILEREMHESC